ncbi:MAG: NAD(+)/NADH kinase [candidate division WOR-3 bacterium]
MSWARNHSYANLSLQLRIGLIVNLRRPRADVVPQLAEQLSAQGHELIAESSTCQTIGLLCQSRTDERFVSECDLVLALGGDGTLLRAAQLVGSSQVPIMGINLGELGFLTEFSHEQAITSVNSYIKGECREEQRMLLQVDRWAKRAATAEQVRYFALNDASINMGPVCRALELAISVNRHYLTRFLADGVVLATPTGSTGYSLAAGGPIVFPTLEAILITPLSPHALAARPLVAAPDDLVQLELGDRHDADARLVIDGQCQATLAPGDRIQVKRADYKIRLITPPERSYYQILRRKMKWGGRDENDSRQPRN